MGCKEYITNIKWMEWSDDWMAGWWVDAHRKLAFVTDDEWWNDYRIHTTVHKIELLGGFVYFDAGLFWGDWNHRAAKDGQASLSQNTNGGNRQGTTATSFRWIAEAHGAYPLDRTPLRSMHQAESKERGWKFRTKIRGAAAAVSRCVAGHWSEPGWISSSSQASTGCYFDFLTV